MNQNRKRSVVAKKLLPAALAIALTVSGTGIPTYAQDAVVRANNNRYIMKQTAVVANDRIKNIEFASNATKKIEITNTGYKLNDGSDVTVYNGTQYNFTTNGKVVDAQIVIAADVTKKITIVLDNFHVKTDENDKKVIDIRNTGEVHIVTAGAKSSSISGVSGHSAIIGAADNIETKLILACAKDLYLKNTDISIKKGAFYVGVNNDEVGSLYSNGNIVAKDITNAGIIAADAIGSAADTELLSIDANVPNGKGVVYCNTLNVRLDKDKILEHGVVYTGTTVGTTITEDSGSVTKCEATLANGTGIVYGKPELAKADIKEPTGSKLKADLATAVTLSAISTEFLYNGNDQKAAIEDAIAAKLVFRTPGLFPSKTLAKTTDYTFDFGSVADYTKNVGKDKEVTINAVSGSNLLTGSTKAKFTIKGIELSNVVVEPSTADKLVYDGTEKTREVKVYTDSTKATELPASDFEVTGNKQTNAGTYELTVTGKGNHSFEKKLSWTIEQKEIKVDTVTVDAKEYDGTKTANVSAVTFKDTTSTANPANLAASDYTATAEFESANAGTGNKKATVTVTLKKDGNYKFVEEKYVATKDIMDGTINKATLVAPAANAGMISYEVDKTEGHNNKFTATVKMNPVAPKVGKYQYQAVKAALSAANSVPGNWKDSNVIDNLDSKETYTFFVKVVPDDAEKDNYNESSESKYEKQLDLFKRDKLPKLDVTVTGENTARTVTIAEVEGAEYKFGSDNYGTTNKKEGIDSTQPTNNKITVSVKLPEKFPYAEAVATEEVDLTKATDTSAPIIKVVADGNYEVDSNHSDKFKIKLKAEPANVENRTIEYKRSDKETWQDSAEFDNIDPESKIDFYARVKAETSPGTKGAGKTGEPLSITFNKLTPAKPTLTKTVTDIAGGKKKITITEVPGAEYTFDGGETWKSDWASNKAEKEFKAEGSVKIGIRLVETATYKASEEVFETITLANINNNGGSYNGGGSVVPSTPSNATEQTKPEDKPNDKKSTEHVKQGEEKITATTDTKGKAKVQVSAEKVTAEVAKTEAGKNVKLEIEVAKGTKSVSLGLEKAAVESILKSEAKGLEIKTAVANIVLNKTALKAIDNKIDSDVVIAVAQAKKTKGSKAVYNLTIKSGDTKITSLGKGNATISLPYKKAASEKSSGIYVVTYNKNGKAVKVKGSKYNAKTGKITFKLNKATKFAIMYKAPRAKKK